MATRKENAEKLEAMATKKPKLSGLKNMKTSSKIALVILVVVVLLAVLASAIAPYDPFEIGMARQAPDAAHLFGVGTFIGEGALGDDLSSVQFGAHPVDGEAVHLDAVGHGFLDGEVHLHGGLHVKAYQFTNLVNEGVQKRNLLHIVGQCQGTLKATFGLFLIIMNS